MAKGCLNGPQTRECYFLPLTSNCNLSDVDDISSDQSVVLKSEKDEYDAQNEQYILIE